MPSGLYLLSSRSGDANHSLKELRLCADILLSNRRKNKRRYAMEEGGQTAESEALTHQRHPQTSGPASAKRESGGHLNTSQLAGLRGSKGFLITEQHVFIISAKGVLETLLRPPFSSCKRAKHRFLFSYAFHSIPHLYQRAEHTALLLSIYILASLSTAI